LDPNALLERMRKLTARVLKETEEEDHSYAQTMRDTTSGELAQLFQHLDQWITGGGFLPKDWRRT